MIFSKKLLPTTLSALMSFSSMAGNYVEDFGSGGLFGDTDLLDHAEEFIGFGGTCQDATKAEFDLVEDHTDTVNIQHSEGIKTTRGFDNWTEELVFTAAAQNVAKQINCQGKLFDGLDRNISKVREMEAQAWAYFAQAQSKIKELLTQEGLAQEDLTIVNRAYNFQEDRFSATTTRYFQEQRQQKQAALNEVKAKIALAMSRIPLGNRQEMRDQLRELMSSNNVTKASFLSHYRQGVSKLKQQAWQSRRFFNEIKVKDRNHTYLIDEDLKKSLTRTGVIANTLEGIGLESELQNKFMCRANARYKRGPEALLAAEIPLYFAGVYGLGRAAVAMGAKAIHATSTAARVGANAAHWGAKAAMLGIEMYAYARIADEVRQVCWPDEFTSAIQKGSCSFESEVQGVYQEASIAQCATMAALGFGPLAAMGAYRVAKPIIVSASKTRVRDFYLSAARSDELAKSQRLQRIIKNDDLDSATASRLTDEERIFVFESIADVALTRAQAQRLLNAHKAGRGYGNYTLAEIRLKANTTRQVLAEQGITGAQARATSRQLMRRGVIGSQELSQTAQTKIGRIRELTENKPLEKTELSYRNDLSSNPESIPDILQDYPQFMKAHEVANDLMSNGSRWNTYLEDVVTEVFLRMSQSSNTKVVQAAQEGIMARSTLLEVFKDRFAARNLKISTIPKNANPDPVYNGVLTSEMFKDFLRKGPLLDDAFKDAGTLTQHGPYPHLFQLDYLLDDMVKANPKNKPQDFFNFWGGSDEGLSVWNDMFDQFDQTPGRTGPHTLKDTRAVTERYLDDIGIDNSI